MWGVFAGIGKLYPFVREWLEHRANQRLLADMRFAKGWLIQLESRTYVRFTEAGSGISGRAASARIASARSEVLRTMS